MVIYNNQIEQKKYRVNYLNHIIYNDNIEILLLDVTDKRRHHLTTIHSQ